MIKIFSGTASLSLTNNVLKILKKPLSASSVVRFDNSEVKVKIEENVKNQTCVVIQSTANPTDTHLMELFFFCDALRRQEAKKVIGFIPYFGYARQDIQHTQGECVSANVVIRFLEAIGFSKIYTIDLHDEATEGVFSIPFKNLTALPLLAKEIKHYLLNQKIPLSETVVISPDQGGIERARKFSLSFYGENEFSLAVIEKKRNLQVAHESKALNLYGNVGNKVAIIVDDIVTSGKTLINAANLCLKHKAKKVIAVIIHPDFSAKAPSILSQSNIDKIFSTDTITLSDEKKFEKLQIVSVAPLIAEEIKQIIKNV